MSNTFDEPDSWQVLPYRPKAVQLIWAVQGRRDVAGGRGRAVGLIVSIGEPRPGVVCDAEKRTDVFEGRRVRTRAEKPARPRMN